MMVYECPVGVYSAFASVTPPLGYREESRIFDERGLLKVFFTEVDPLELAVFSAP